MIAADPVAWGEGWLCVGSIALVFASCTVTFLVLADRHERRAVRAFLAELLGKDRP